MTRFSRLVIAMLTACGLLLELAPIAAQAFTDVKTSGQYSTAINALQQKEVLQGYSDGTFKPTAHINRAEFAKIVASAVYDRQKIDTCAELNSPFKDMQKTEWYSPYVCILRNHGAISGYPDGTFKPDREINFVEATKILTGAYGMTLPFSESAYTDEWYVGFVEAFESSNAIPPSVAKLDAALTRGEMAEMMWRISEGKTDQPSKGLLNLQHPELKINTASDTVQYAASCAELQVFATQAQTSGNPGMMYMKDGMGVAAPMANEVQTNTDYSHTNVQVEGVDEADIVKTDGTFVYVLSNREKPVVRIIRAQPATSMKVESTIDLSSSGMSPTEIYVEENTLIVVGVESTYGGPIPFMQEKMMAPSIWPGYGFGQKAQVRIYDVSSAANPKLTRTVSLDGSFLESRRIGNKLYLVLQSPFAIWGDPHIMEKSSIVPQMTDSRTGKTTDMAPCNRIAILPRIPSPQYLTVATIPVNDTNAQVKTSVVLGSAQNVYASLQSLYVTTPRWNYIWDSAHPESQEKTHLFRFAFTDEGVELKAQGDVPGHILNQFSMDESGANFRIATTVSESWGDESSTSTNNLYVLDMNLAQVGSVTDIAPGETIYSTRFMGNRAYMVTFKTIDPFFVIDLSSPKAPRVLGNLKVPGFSNYLHPYDATHVIGFGKDADPSIDADKVHSGNAIYYTAVQGLKMALFDVSDVENPKEMAVTVIGDRGTDSPLLTNHKALLFEKDRNLLAFPIMVTKRPDGSAKSADGNPVFQGAYVYDISLQNGFKLRGTVTHYDSNDQFLKAGTYWYGGDKDIQRIVRLGNSLVTVSDTQVRSSDEKTVQQQGKLDVK